MDGLSRTRHWALGAVIAALCSFAYAKVPGGAHGSGAYSHGNADRAMHVQMHGGGRYASAAGAPSARASRNSTMSRDSHGQRGGNSFADANYGYGYGPGGYNGGVRRLGTPSGYADERGRMQYAGAITPVSAESRPVPRPPSNMPMRNGSIRADVARYNEERGAGRSLQRPADDPRPPEGSPYRN
ncbi:hypothetical protein [Paraburkholderia sp. ZP32-5]|uniref:hypothetical protein n=1 Tax=Paraburkholderia sp. ZP32-5 TaxID=2883245 RepID=UPI001F1A18A3|nr:hypothetical protein [Paraburkholderia sp. ZP32-5]